MCIRDSVWVYPLVDDNIDVEILDKDLRIDTYRSSGAGGQHVNTTDSAVRITHLPSKIVVQCQNERSQHKNKETCFKMLKARLYEHEIKKRDEKNKKELDTKTDIGWGYQIRSYVLQPYRLVKDLRFKTALNTEFSGEQLSEILLKISEIVDIFNKIPVRYDKKVLEQIAISGCLDTNKFSDNQNNIKEAVNYISQRINISRPDYDRGWKGSFIEGGFKFTRELRGVDENIVIDKDLLNSQLIENLNKNYVDIFQMFEMPGMAIKKDDMQIEIFSPSQLLEIVNENGKKGLSLQRYKGLGEMNPEQLWETTLDPINRTLIQVRIDDVESTKGIFEDLMGENVVPRKEFIESRADSVVNLDI